MRGRKGEHRLELRETAEILPLGQRLFPLPCWLRGKCAVARLQRQTDCALAVTCIHECLGTAARSL
jgi:hypothetical protein